MAWSMDKSMKAIYGKGDESVIDSAIKLATTDGLDYDKLSPKERLRYLDLAEAKKFGGPYK